MSTSSAWLPRWSNATILVACAGILALTLAIHPLWNASILKAATDGLNSSQGWFSTALYLGNAFTWIIGMVVAVGSVIASREQARIIVLLPLLLGIALIATPLWKAAQADSTWARSTVLERLIEQRKQGQPSSAEARLLTALVNRDQVSIASAFHALSPAQTSQLALLQESMGMSSQALKAKGFAEHSDVDAAVDFSRTHPTSKEVQQQLYALLARTEPRHDRR